MVQEFVSLCRHYLLRTLYPICSFFDSDIPLRETQDIADFTLYPEVF